AGVRGAERARMSTSVRIQTEDSARIGNTSPPPTTSRRGHRGSGDAEPRRLATASTSRNVTAAMATTEMPKRIHQSRATRSAPVPRASRTEGEEVVHPVATAAMATRASGARNRPARPPTGPHIPWPMGGETNRIGGWHDAAGAGRSAPVDGQRGRGHHRAGGHDPPPVRGGPPLGASHTRSLIEAAVGTHVAGQGFEQVVAAVGPGRNVRLLGVE